MDTDGVLNGHRFTVEARNNTVNVVDCALISLKFSADSTREP
jgi:hypothetical protein